MGEKGGRASPPSSSAKKSLASARSMRQVGSTAILSDGSAITADAAVRLLVGGGASSSTAESVLNPLLVKQQQVSHMTPCALVCSMFSRSILALMHVPLLQNESAGGNPRQILQIADPPASPLWLMFRERFREDITQLDTLRAELAAVSREKDELARLCEAAGISATADSTSNTASDRRLLRSALTVRSNTRKAYTQRLAGGTSGRSSSETPVRAAAPPATSGARRDSNLDDDSDAGSNPGPSPISASAASLAPS